MAIIKSSSDHIVINADGASKDIKFQANGVEKASISSAGVMTATSFVGSGASLTNLPAGGATTLDGLTDCTVSSATPTVSSNPSAVGHLWIEEDSGAYVCTDATAGANVWLKLGYSSGQVVQVVTESDTGGSNDSGTIGWRDTHLSVSITPKYSNSKMVVMANCYIYMNNTSGECGFGLDYTRAIAGGATTGLSPSPGTEGASHWSIGNGERSVRYSHHAIDSPNTTSATTYTLRIAGTGSANTIWGWQSTADTLVVMEIKV